MTIQPYDFASDQRKIAQKFGPFLIGVCLNMILYGVLLMQILTYFQTYKKDRWALKALIYYLLIIETLGTGLDMYIIYRPLIQEYGTEPAHANFSSLLGFEPTLIGLVGTPVQLFIAYRIKAITSSVWVPASICLLSLVSMAASFWTGAILSKGPTLFIDHARLWRAVLVWLLTAAVCDILLTAALVQALYKRKRGSFEAMDSVLNKIILLTVQTGMITAITAVLDLILFLAIPHASVNFICGLALSKLYANCILSTLNARHCWNNDLINGRRDPNFLWGADEENPTKDSGPSSNETITPGMLVFANPVPTSNIDSGTRVTMLSHRPQTYEIEMGWLSSREHDDMSRSQISLSSIQTGADKTNVTKEEPLSQEPNPARTIS